LKAEILVGGLGAIIFEKADWRPKLQKKLEGYQFNGASLGFFPSIK
jgi:hypothetical protein